MALLPADPGGVQPRRRRGIASAAFVIRGDPDAEMYSATDTSVESGTAVPTHALPGSMTNGYYTRTGGSIAAMLYATADSGATWTAVAIP